MSYVFFDTETTGLDPRFDQIIQFAAIKTDDEFAEIDRINIRCRVQPHVIPSATALAINQTSIARCFDQSLPSHCEMMTVLKATLEAWSPAVFCGWNSISFDEEFLRFGFYQSLQPSYLTSRFGNARLDILKIAQAAYAFRPQSLHVPVNHKGHGTFSLDPLSRANGYEPAHAHDALSDVQTTIHLAKILKKNAPAVWSQAVRFSKKASVEEFLSAGEVCILTESFKGKTYQYPVVQIGVDPSYSSLLVVADVTKGYSKFSDLTDDEKLDWLGASPQPIRKVKANASPMLMPVEEIDSFRDLAVDFLLDAAQELSANESLCRDLTSTFLDRIDHEFKNEFVEQQLYDNFADRKTEQQWLDFHQAPWENRWEIVKNMHDARYRKLGVRLIFEHSPSSLPTQTQKMMTEFVATKISGAGLDNPPWRTIPKATADFVEARAQEVYSDQANIFDEYDIYLSGLSGE